LYRKYLTNNNNNLEMYPPTPIELGTNVSYFVNDDAINQEVIDPDFVADYQVLIIDSLEAYYKLKNVTTKILIYIASKGVELTEKTKLLRAYSLVLVCTEETVPSFKLDECCINWVIVAQVVNISVVEILTNHDLLLWRIFYSFRKMKEEYSELGGLLHFQLGRILAGPLDRTRAELSKSYPLHLTFIDNMHSIGHCCRHDFSFDGGHLKGSLSSREAVWRRELKAWEQSFKSLRAELTTSGWWEDD